MAVIKKQGKKLAARRTFGGVTQHSLTFTAAANYSFSIQLHTAFLGLNPITLHGASASLIAYGDDIVAASPSRWADLIVGLTSEAQILEAVATAGFTYSGVSNTDIFSRNTTESLLTGTVALNSTTLRDFYFNLFGSSWCMYQTLPENQTFVFPNDFKMESTQDQTLIMFATFPQAFHEAATSAVYYYQSSYSIDGGNT